MFAEWSAIDRVPVTLGTVGISHEYGKKLCENARVANNIKNNAVKRFVIALIEECKFYMVLVRG